MRSLSIIPKIFHAPFPSCPKYRNYRNIDPQELRVMVLIIHQCLTLYCILLKSLARLGGGSRAVQSIMVSYES